MPEPIQLVAHICPDCGQQITNRERAPSRGHYYGHYHERPADWPHDEDPWVDAVEVACFREEDVRPLVAALEAISGLTCECTGYYRCNGCEREAPRLADAALVAFSVPDERKAGQDA